MRRALIAVALLLVSCVSALADSKSELVAWGMRMRAVIIQNACYPQGERGGAGAIQRGSRRARPL